MGGFGRNWLDLNVFANFFYTTWIPAPTLLRDSFDKGSTALRHTITTLSKRCRRTVGEQSKNNRSWYLSGNTQVSIKVGHSSDSARAVVEASNNLVTAHHAPGAYAFQKVGVGRS